MSGAPLLSNLGRRERTRRIVHLSAGACALLVGPLGRAGAAALAGMALLYNAWVAPAFGLDTGYRRPGEGFWSGLTTYPLAVLLLVLVAPPAVAAGAWVVLAAGDPTAAAVGSRLRAPRVPLNPEKSLAGTLAAFVAGSLACYAILRHMDAGPALPAAVGAGAAGAVAEALPLRGDDNLRIAAASAVALWVFLR